VVVLVVAFVALGRLSGEKDVVVVGVPEGLVDKMEVDDSLSLCLANLNGRSSPLPGALDFFIGVDVVVVDVDEVEEEVLDFCGDWVGVTSDSFQGLLSTDIQVTYRGFWETKV